jgi:hypothetical protein
MNEQSQYAGAAIEELRFPQPEAALNNRPMIAQNAELAPTAQSRNIGRAIEILPVDHGFYVTINCQRFAVESKEALLHRLGLYLSDPGKVEQDWMSGKLKW